MMSKVPEWKEFEREVAQLYRDLGAINVVDDVNLAGNQVDVYAEVPLPDGSYNRYAISCKRYNDAAGVADVREWHHFVRALRDANLVDTGVVVSRVGFSREAKELAATLGIKLFSLS